jgi:hypothetical protein
MENQSQARKTAIANVLPEMDAALEGVGQRNEKPNSLTHEAMSGQQNTPPKFKNDHDALLFLIEKHNFEGGWIGPAGMGNDGDIEMDASAPEWAKIIGFNFVSNFHCVDHPVLNMAMEYIHCTFRQEDSKLLLTRSWNSPIKSEGPSVLQPRPLQEAITSILGIKSIYSGDDTDDCSLNWTKDSETGQFIPETDEFVLYNSEFNNITCNNKQALEILDTLRQPGITEDKYWSSFSLIDSIHLTFARLDGNYHYCITGMTKPEDMTELCLISQENCRL